MLEVKNLTFGYRKSAPVISDLSLTLGEGCVYGLLGRNGTGKSTLLYLAMGLLRPQSGTILMDGREPQQRLPETLQEMFIVPEEYDLPSISLANYVKSIRPFYPRFSDETLRQSLSSFDMPLDLHLGALSMGQKKKVYMSVALAANTKVLLMDEPTNGLDIPSKAQFRKVMAGGMDESKTVVISTHQVRDVETLLDHLCVIDQNRVLLNDSMERVGRSLRFVMVPGTQLPDETVYAEQVFGGFNAILPSATGEETPINLELLFNALLYNNDRVQAALLP